MLALQAEGQLMIPPCQSPKQSLYNAFIFLHLLLSGQNMKLSYYICNVYLLTITGFWKTMNQCQVSPLTTAPT